MEFVWKKNVGFRFKIGTRFILGVVGLCGTMIMPSYMPSIVSVLRAALGG